MTFEPPPPIVKDGGANNLPIGLYYHLSVSTVRGFTFTLLTFSRSYKHQDDKSRPVDPHVRQLIVSVHIKTDVKLGATAIITALTPMTRARNAPYLVIVDHNTMIDKLGMANDLLWVWLQVERYLPSSTASTDAGLLWPDVADQWRGAYRTYAGSIGGN